MSELASKSALVKEGNRHRAPKPVAPFAAQRSPTFTDHNTLHRRASCSCGGGCPACQAKSNHLNISQPNDPAEIEADQIADKVMRMPVDDVKPKSNLANSSNAIHRKCDACEEEDEEAAETVQRKEAFPLATPTPPPGTPPNIRNVISSGGQPLDQQTRNFFEPRFGYDLSGVRLHTDPSAGRSARAINARAYTLANNIVFGSGEYKPESESGKHLIAHELAHVGQSGAGKINRQTIYRQPVTKVVEPAITTLALHDSCSSTPFLSFGMSNPEMDKLYFAQRGRYEGCASCHPNVQKPIAGPVPVENEVVTESSLLQWAINFVWFRALDNELTKRDIFRRLMLGEDKELHAIWESYREETIGIVSSDFKDDIVRPTFKGSTTSRCHFAKYLRSNWSRVPTDLPRMGEDWLVREIRKAISTGLVPGGSSLVVDRARIRQIENAPDKEIVYLGRHGATATTGFEWMGKRMVSVLTQTIYYELTGFEGIYFQIGYDDFFKTDPFVGKVVSDVVKNTAMMSKVGGFVKGFLTGLASPVILVADTAAKVVDMASMGVSAAGQASGWYRLGYTCLSSTCRQYEQCIQAGSHTKCQEEALTGAIKEATIIIPILEQGADCFHGNEEACGEIAALALGLVKEGVSMRMKSKAGARMSPIEFQETLIRERINRPMPGDAGILKALEESKSAEKAKEASQKQAKAQGKGGPKEPSPLEEIAQSAKEKGLNSKTLTKEVGDITHLVEDPNNIVPKTDPTVDAGITTKASGEEHHFERSKSDKTWCRYSKRACGLRLGKKLNQAVDVALAKRQAILEFANGLQLLLNKWIGKKIKPGDKLPQGYHWREGKIVRSKGMREANYAPLEVSGGKVAIGEGGERISNPSTMRRNYKDVVTAELRKANPNWTDKSLKAEVAKLVDKNAVHHLIPDNIVQDHPLAKTAREKAGYDLDRGSNLEGLPKSKDLTDVAGGETGHWTSHPKYDQIVKGELDKAEAGLVKEFGSLDKVPKQRLLDTMTKIEAQMRKLIEEGKVPTKDGRLAETEPNDADDDRQSYA